MIELKEITWDNFWQVINLTPNTLQTKYLPPISVFMAQAYVNLKFNYPDICFALYNDAHLIGFTKIVYVPKEVKPYYFIEDSYMIDAIMIDVNYQGKGYGKAGLRQVLKYIETKPFGKANSIKLSCHDDNTIAINIYKEFGFHKTEKWLNKNKNFFIYSKKINK